MTGLISHLCRGTASISPFCFEAVRLRVTCPSESEKPACSRGWVDVITRWSQSDRCRVGDMSTRAGLCQTSHVNAGKRASGGWWLWLVADYYGAVHVSDPLAARPCFVYSRKHPYPPLPALFDNHQLHHFLDYPSFTDPQWSAESLSCI